MLEVVNVSKRFGGLVAVDDVSFQVNKHEVFGLIGPNGSGKTTMMNLISGAHKTTSGDIYFQERLISGMPPRGIFLRGVARTFQLVKPPGWPHARRKRDGRCRLQQEPPLGP